METCENVRELRPPYTFENGAVYEGEWVFWNDAK